METFYRKAIDI